MKKTNFVGGKLTFKNAKEDNITKKMKKIMTRDAITKTIPQKGKTYILDGDSELVRSIEEHNIAEKMERMENQKENNDKEQPYVDTRTAAEKRFDEINERRLPEKIETIISTTFKEKFDKFGQNLSKIPVHYDIPKVGPG